MARPGVARLLRAPLVNRNVLRVLECLDPPHAILVVPYHLQAGLISAVMRYNDARFGLPWCHLTLFHPDGRVAVACPEKGESIGPL